MTPFRIEWEAPEYEYREKGVAWYWISIIVAALVIAFSVWERNFLFGVFVIVAEILLIAWGNRAPRIVHCAIDATHLSVEGAREHALKDFESMSIDPLGNGWAEISFLARAKFRAPFKVLFPEARLNELREGLKTVLKEIPYEPSFIDTIEKLLRF